MKVKFTETVSTLGDRYLKDEIYEVSVNLANQWIKNGWAAKVQPKRAKQPRSKVV